MGNEFQNPAGAAGVLAMPIDSQSPWQNGKTERAGQSFKHQLWDLDEECHIEGETEFEAAVAECCDARNRYCNQSGFSAHQRVFGSSLRLPGSLLSDDPIDRQLLTEDPYTNFHRTNKMRTAAQRAFFKKILHVRYKLQDWHVTYLSRERTSMQEIRPWCGVTTIWLEEKGGPSLLWSWECTCYGFQRFVWRIGQWFTTGWPIIRSGSANHWRVYALSNVDLDGVRTIETRLTPWQRSRERIRSRCSPCCVMECWRIVQLNDKLELYHDTKWAQSRQWRSEFFCSFAMDLFEMVVISVSWKEFSKIDGCVDRTLTQKTHLCSAACSQARNAHHARASRRHTLQTRLSRTLWLWAHITFWFKKSQRVSDKIITHMFERSLLVLVLSSSSLSRASTTFLSHCLLVLCPAHQLPCRRNRRGLKPVHSRTGRSVGETHSLTYALHFYQPLLLCDAMNSFSHSVS